MDAVNEKLMRDLRRLAPHVVRVFDSADEFRDVAVPARRKRWAQVIETIEARPWVRCELRAKGGAVLGYIEHEESEGDAAMADAPPEGAHMRWYLDMMLRAQTAALQFVAKEHATVLGSVREILEVQTEAMRETIGLMRMQRDAASEIAALKASANQQDDGLGEIVKLVEASPKLMEKLGPMLAMLLTPRRIAAAKPANGANGAKPATPPNGAPKP